MIVQNVLASDCYIQTSSIVLATGSSLISGNCPQDGAIQSSSIYVDASSQFVLQNWWNVEADEITLLGIVYASAVSFAVKTVNIHGGINADGRGFGPALGPGAGGSDTSNFSCVFKSIYRTSPQVDLEEAPVMVQMACSLAEQQQVFCFVLKM